MLVVPSVAAVAKRLVDEAVPEKKLVVVALVAVALPPIVIEATVVDPSE
jgi:hypothetical protein